MALSNLLPKLFIEILLIFFYSLARRHKRAPSLQALGLIIIILIVRDVAYAFVGIDYILSLSNVVVISLYLFWLRSVTGPRIMDLYYLVINILVVVFTVANLFLRLLPLSNFHVTLWLFVDIFYLSLFMGTVSEYNTENAEYILKTRFAVISVLILTNLIILLYGYHLELIQSVLIPLSYFLNAYLLYCYINQIREEEGRTVNLYASSLDAMFDFMSNLGNAIAERIDLPKVLEIILSSAVKNTAADAGAILMIDESENTLRPRAIHGIFPPLEPVPDIVKVRPSNIKRYFSEKPIEISKNVLGEVARSGQPLMIKNTLEDERMKHNTRDDILFVSSIIIIPFVVSNRVLGVLSALKRAENQFFDENDFLHLKIFADYASITIDNIYTYLEAREKQQIEREVGIAAEIQQKLLPLRVPELDHASLAFFSQPAKGVSGDYYDIFRLDNDKIGLVICDVAGKGIPAALIMVMIRSILHLIVSNKRESASILTWINHGLTGRIEADHFATLAFVIYDQKSGEVVYANAAHPPLLVYRSKTKRLEQVDTKGLPLGIEKNAQYGQKRFRLEKGDLLILYTDGIVEAMNPEGRQYTLKTLGNIIVQGSMLHPKDLVRRIEADLKKFVGKAKQHDDQTLLLMKANEKGEGVSAGKR